MNLALWIVQGLLAFAFIAAGAMKVFAYKKYNAMSEKKNGPTGPSRGLITFIGMAEIAGSFGIVLPMAPTSLRDSARGPQSDSRSSCCWQLVFTRADMSRWPYPSSFSCWQGL
jgi:hypothetical protein